MRVVDEHTLVFPNFDGNGMFRSYCLRDIYKMELVEYSVNVPTRDHHSPEPDWKRDEAFCDATPRKYA
jgi:hypothetical protein